MADWITPRQKSLVRPFLQQTMRARDSWNGHGPAASAGEAPRFLDLAAYDDYHHGRLIDA